MNHVKTIAYPVKKRHFIGGSDARIIVGNDEQALIRLWREKRGKSSRKICQVISSCRLGSRPKSSIAAGTKPVPGRSSPTFKSECVTRRYAG
jgi:hypothetical protein